MRKLFSRIENMIDLMPLNISYYLIGGQIIVFAIILIYPVYEGFFGLQGRLLLQGEWWRTITFLFEPIVGDLLFAVFTWYLFYIYGTTLERWWGATRFLAYLLIAVVGTIILSFIFPDTRFSNGYIFNSLFLAFAYIFPNFELRLFFFIPVRIKWLAIISWIVIGLSFLITPIPNKLHILVSVLNFIIFFGQDIARHIFDRSQHRTKQMAKKQTDGDIIHTCSVCGKNSKDDPYMGIRYCNTCIPERCFCERDFQKHNHLVN